MSFIVQTAEDEVLGIIDRTFFQMGWDVLSLIFDGLIAEGAKGCDPAPLEDVLKASEEACCSNPGRSWKIKLAVKPLNGMYRCTAHCRAKCAECTGDAAPMPLPTITAAREAMLAFEASPMSDPAWRPPSSNSSTTVGVATQ